LGKRAKLPDQDLFQEQKEKERERSWGLKTAVCCSWNLHPPKTVLHSPLNKMDSSVPGFLNLSTTNIWRRYLFEAIWCLARCLPPFLVSNHQTPVACTPHTVTTKNVSRHCQMSPEKQNHHKQEPSSCPFWKLHGQ
jgi:hypothetical protein